MFFLIYVACGLYLWLLGTAVFGGCETRRSLFHAPWLGYAVADRRACRSCTSSRAEPRGLLGIPGGSAPSAPPPSLRSGSARDFGSATTLAEYRPRLSWRYFLESAGLSFFRLSTPRLRPSSTMTWVITTSDDSLDARPSRSSPASEISFSISPSTSPHFLLRRSSIRWVPTSGAIPCWAASFRGWDSASQSLRSSRASVRLLELRGRLEPIEKAYLISSPAWIYTLLTANISSNSPDIPSACLQIHLFLCFASFLAAKDTRPSRDEFTVLLILAALSLSVKLNRLFRRDDHLRAGVP